MNIYIKIKCCYDKVSSVAVIITKRKEREAMLEKVKNQENIIMIFFVVTLLGVGTYIVVERSIIDVIYFGVLVYYFGRFLSIKRNRK